MSGPSRVLLRDCGLCGLRIRVLPSRGLAVHACPHGAECTPTDVAVTPGEPTCLKCRALSFITCPECGRGQFPEPGRVMAREAGCPNDWHNPYARPVSEAPESARIPLDFLFSPPGTRRDPLAHAQRFHVRDFGALGDGVADDSAAITAAATAAAAARPILVHAESWSVQEAFVRLFRGPAFRALAHAWFRR